MKETRQDRFEKAHEHIQNNPHKYAENIEDYDTPDGDYMSKGIINEMSGDPIQQVHQLKQKKRDKLKKYLYQGRYKHGYNHSKHKLQNGKGTSLALTPDFTFKKVHPKEKQRYHKEILEQMQADRLKKQKLKNLDKQTERKNQMLYDRKMKTIEKIIHRSREDQKKRYINNISTQMRNKKIYGTHL